MAYNTDEERLKVRGSEQITRDLKVAGEILAGDDVTISGDLYVNGTEYINNSETAQTTDDYLVLRHNQTTPLGTNEYSGVAVYNYATGKTATITTDKDGTWRVADNTETDTNYTNISYYNGTFYTGLTRTAATVTSGMKTAFDEDELDESVYYNNSYYHFDGSNWFPVSLVDNKLTLGSAVTDSATITALNALTKEDLVYFRTLTITVINPVENQPLLTRAETGDLTGGQALVWDATNQKAVGKTIDTTVTANSSNLITSGAVKTAVDNEAIARDSAIASTIDSLDVADSPVAGKYVSSVSETNGKITVVREDLGNLAVSGIKGNAELNYRRGLVNLTPADIGAVNKAGDTVTGSISRDSGGSYISGRDNAVIKQTKSNAEGQSWNPAISVKTVSGNWTMGSVGGETLQLSYDTDANYNVDNNDSAVINFPTAGSTGTLALTSQIPTANSQLTNDSGYLTASGTIANANHATSADSATNANHATSADSATNANHATNADSATNAGNADTVDGYHASELATGSTVAARDASGYLNANIFHDTWATENINSYTSPTVMFKGNGDGYLRNTSLADLRTALGVPYAQVNSDWNATSGVAQILNKPSFDLDDTTGIKNFYVETDNQYAKCSVGRALSYISKRAPVIGNEDSWAEFINKVFGGFNTDENATIYNPIVTGTLLIPGESTARNLRNSKLQFIKSSQSGHYIWTLYIDSTKVVWSEASVNVASSKWTYDLYISGGADDTYYKRRFNVMATIDHFEDLNGNNIDNDSPSKQQSNPVFLAMAVYNISTTLPQDLDPFNTSIEYDWGTMTLSGRVDYSNICHNLLSAYYAFYEDTSGALSPRFIVDGTDPDYGNQQFYATCYTKSLTYDLAQGNYFTNLKMPFSKVSSTQIKIPVYMAINNYESYEKIGQYRLIKQVMNPIQNVVITEYYS